MPNFSPLSKSPDPTLGHLTRLFASSAGTDKVFMFVQYFSDILVYALNNRKTSTALDLAQRIAGFRAVVADSRVLYRLFGLFPIIQWAQSLNSPAAATKDKTQKLIERLQVLSMLLYYPLEHFYYLSGKGLFRARPETLKKAAVWSCRFWASYVVLQFLHIRRGYQIVRESEESEVVDDKNVKTANVEKRRSLFSDLLVQIGYLPLTAHWSVEGGVLPDQVFVGLFGTLAAVYQVKARWLATA